MVPKKKHKLDIFKLMKNISNSNTKYWGTLNEDEIKAFSPFVLTRWLSSNSEYEIQMVNQLVSKYVFTLGTKHKQLMFNLMCISTIPNSRYSYKKRSANQLKFPKTTKIISEYLGYSIKDTLDVASMYSNENVLEMAEELGLQKTDINVIKKELKKRHV